MKKEIELTILMPCLNEAETIRRCIKKARCFMNENNVQGEILIADNGSTDNSVQIALAEGARVIHVIEKGYGAALIGGCDSAKGKYVIMGDADDSYDFINLMPFLENLRCGYDLVMGNRFAGGIEKEAMPWSHRYIGNPILSFIGRLFFKSKIRDFHCGLRGYNKKAIQKLNLHTTGMEYASEMIVSAQLYGLKITEVPTTLKKDGRSRPPHLRSVHDGWRHLKFLFMYAPTWLFLYPGVFMIMFSIFGGAYLIIKELRFQNVTFSIHTLLFCAAFLMIGVNMVLLFIMTKIYATHNGFIPDRKNNWIHKINEDYFIFFGSIIVFIGLGISVFSFVLWSVGGFSSLIPEQMMRLVIPAVTSLEIGSMFVLSGFFIGILKIGNKNCLRKDL